MLAEQYLKAAIMVVAPIERSGAQSFA